MRITLDKMNRLDGQVCFICGRFLLNYEEGDIAYMEIVVGGATKAKPERYHLFECPSCGKMGHKRCWYEHAQKQVGGGIFRASKGWQMNCPSCGHPVVSLTTDRKDWKRGYQIPGHPDSDIPEIYLSDVTEYKAGAFLGKIGAAIGGIMKAVAVGISNLTNAERNLVAAAAKKIGQPMSSISDEVIRLNIPADQRSQLKELRCQHCGANLPLPGKFDDAVICGHCNTAHLL